MKLFRHHTLALIALTLGLILSACAPLQLDGLPTLAPTLTLPQPTSTGSRDQDASITGLVWHDLCAPGADGQPAPVTPPKGCRLAPDGGFEANGLLEPGEPGIEGVSVSLGLGPCPASGLAVTTTDGSGRFTFANLASATYCVSVDAGQNWSLMPGGWTAPAGSNGTSEAHYTIVLPPNQTLSGANFGWDHQFLPAPDTATPSPEAPTATFTPSPTACLDHAAFVVDVTVPDRSNIPAGTAFVKTWRLRNIGTCTWTTAYSLIVVGGPNLGSAVAVPLAGPAAPGQSVDLSVTLTAPAGNGTYTSYWQLRNAQGDRFGVGADGSQPFFVTIVVGPTATPRPTSTATPPPGFAGWRGEYFAQRDFSKAPVLVRDDVNVDFNWGGGSPASNLPADNFAVRWTRSLNFSAGTYRFRVLADDGVRVWLDDVPVIDDWRDGGAGEVSGEIALTSGAHTVRVDYYEAGGLAAIRLWWDAVGNPAFPDWKGEYWPNRDFVGNPALIRNDRVLDFDWAQSAAAVGLPTDDVSARWSRVMTFDAGTYRLSVRADDGVRVFVDNQLVLNEWHDSDGSRVYQTTLNLSGPRFVVVEYFERNGRAFVQLAWERLPNTATPTPTATATAPPSPTPTVTATPTQVLLEATVSGVVWQDVCAQTGQPYAGPGPIPEGCAIGAEDKLLANGTREASEPGLSGVTVLLSEGMCGAVGTDVRVWQATTDAGGRFTFTGLRGGAYCITIDPADARNTPILMAGVWTRTGQAGRTGAALLDLNLVPGEARTEVNFGWDYLSLP